MSAPPPPDPHAVQRLAGAVREAGNALICVVTGAGISLASGIPTFRGSDPEAVWERDVTELGTRRYFMDDPVGSWRWYTSRFDQVLDRRPNAAHHALAALERLVGTGPDRFLLVTQNVDTLHEQAGTEALIKVHGSADRVRCIRFGCVNAAPGGSVARAAIDMQPFFDAPSPETLPRCRECSSLLRQHVLWFDEFYDEHESYQWPRVLDGAERMGLLLFVGTSFSVGVTDLFLRRGLSRGIPVYSVDPGAKPGPHPRVEVLREKCELLLPAVCEALSATASRRGTSSGARRR